MRAQDSAAVKPPAAACRLSRAASRARPSSRRRVSSATPAPRSDISGARCRRALRAGGDPGRGDHDAGSGIPGVNAACGSPEGVSIVGGSAPARARAPHERARRRLPSHDGERVALARTQRQQRHCASRVGGPAAQRQGRVGAQRRMAWARIAAGRACNPCGSATRSDPSGAARVRRRGQRRRQPQRHQWVAGAQRPPERRSTI